MKQFKAECSECVQNAPSYSCKSSAAVAAAEEEEEVRN